MRQREANEGYMIDLDRPELAWKNCRSIENHLKHHYIQQRSVVFIVDTYFESFEYNQIAREQVFNFFDQLGDEDYFGLINLDPNSHTSDITLERKHKNINLKRRQLANRLKMPYNYKLRSSLKHHENLLEDALYTAIKWQRLKVTKTSETINDVEYVGPHKWIVCLLGSDNSSVRRIQKITDADPALLRDVSISILAMTNSRAKQYAI